jgi:hypothetical protein
VCLTTIVIAAIVAMAYVAVRTDRDMTRPEILSFVVALFVAAIGGMSIFDVRRRRRWRLEREDVNGEQGLMWMRTKREVEREPPPA